MSDKWILLVEDNSDDVELTMLAFEESGVAADVLVAKDGLEALDYLFGTGIYHEPRETLPVVVLLDLKLPHMDGLECLRRIRANERTKYLPVVVLTSSQEEQDIVSSYKLGANAYVRKPVNYNEFVEAARELGLFWLIFNQPPPGKRVGT